MKRLQQLLLVLVLAGAIAHSQPTLSLKFSGSLEENGSSLKISWINDGPPCLLTIGTLTGAPHGLTPRIHMSISGPGIQGDIIDTTESGVIGGRAVELVVFVPSHAEYAIRLRTDRLWVSGYKQTLSSLHAKRWVLTVIYRGERASEELPGGRSVPYNVIRDYPVNFPFWVGEITARVVNSSR